MPSFAVYPHERHGGFRTGGEDAIPGKGWVGWLKKLTRPREHRAHIDVDIGVPFRPPHTS